MNDNRLLLYGNTEYSSILHDFCIMTEGDEAAARECAPRFVRALVSVAGETGFHGNIWHDLMAAVMAVSENSYSLAAERRGDPGGSVRDFALSDMEIFWVWFSLDLSDLAERCSLPAMRFLENYSADKVTGKVYSRRICDGICELAEKLAECQDPADMLEAVTQYYASNGVGAIGLHKAFRLGTADGVLRIKPVARIADVRFDDLVGYENAKNELRRNTEAFLEGAPANNCLLYGDAGTGKSSSVKALANTYYDRGLRIIEVYRHEYRYLHELTGILKNRNYRFIIYMDDLSFEEFETDYKYLKAVIEGGLEKKPDNVLIYATSNRRHLIKESFGDKARLSDDDVHRSDTVQEKLSLFDRFGLTIYYGAPSPLEYREIVKALAKREGVDMPEDELLALANRWELKHAGYSGRTARQLIDDILGSRALGRS